MNDSQFQEEISTIRRMIERTRRETFQSGFLFIVPGIIWLISVIILATLELTGRAEIAHKWAGIMFFVIFLTSLGIGVMEGRKVKTQTQTYTRKLFGHLWGACGIVIVLSSMVWPHTGPYAPPSGFLVIGLGFYVTGAIYEIPLVQLGGVAWWIGMLALGFIEGNVRLPIWIATIFFGFILPGIMLNIQYRRLGAANGK